MKIRKVAALIIAFAMLIPFTACDNNKINVDTTAVQSKKITDANDIPQKGDVQTTLPTKDNIQTDNDLTSEKQGSVSGDKSSVKPADTKKGLNSTDTKTVLDFYKAAAEKTGTLDASKHMSIASIDFAPKNDFQKNLFSMFTELADSALKSHSTPTADIPGYYQNLQTSDLNSANAIVSDNYTIVTLNVKSQEENEDTTDWRLGPVGHAVGIVGDFNPIFEAFTPSIIFDHSKGDITVRYDNCKVVVKINNETGKIETGIWSYTINVTLTNIYARFIGFDEVKLNGLGGSVKFDVKTNDQK